MPETWEHPLHISRAIGGAIQGRDEVARSEAASVLSRHMAEQSAEIERLKAELSEAVTQRTRELEARGGLLKQIVDLKAELAAMDSSRAQLADRLREAERSASFNAARAGERNDFARRLIVAEAELARLTASGQVAEDVEEVRSSLEVLFLNEPEFARKHQDDDLSALSRLARQAQGYEAAVAQLTIAQHEVAQMDAALRVVVPDLEARLASTCVWCGTPAPDTSSTEAMRTYVAEHVKTCGNHPMRVVESERDAAVADNAALLGLIQWAASGVAPQKTLAMMREACAEPHPGAALLKERQEQAETIRSLTHRAEEAEKWAEELAARLKDGP